MLAGFYGLMVIRAKFWRLGAFVQMFLFFFIERKRDFLDEHFFHFSPIHFILVHYILPFLIDCPPSFGLVCLLTPVALTTRYEILFPRYVIYLVPRSMQILI